MYTTKIGPSRGTQPNLHTLNTERQAFLAQSERAERERERKTIGRAFLFYLLVLVGVFIHKSYLATVEADETDAENDAKDVDSSASPAIRMNISNQVAETGSFYSFFFQADQFFDSPEPMAINIFKNGTKPLPKWLDYQPSFEVDSYKCIHQTSINTIAIHRDTLLLGGKKGVTLISLKNAISPKVTAQLTSYSHVIGLSVENNHLYIAERDNGLNVLDLQSLSLLGQLDGQDNRYFAVSNNLVFLATPKHLQIISVQNPESPEYISKYSFPCKSDVLLKGMSVKNGYVYLSVANKKCREKELYGIYIIDANNPKHPRFCAFQDTFNSRHLALTDTMLYVADGSSYLQTINITNPYAPYSVNTVLPCIGCAFANDIAVQWPHVYVSGFTKNDTVEPLRGITVFNIENSHHPKLIGHVNLPGFSDIVIGNKTLYSIARTPSENVFCGSSKKLDLRSIRIYNRLSGTPSKDDAGKTLPITIKATNSKGRSELNFSLKIV